MNTLTFKTLEWNSDLVGFVATLSNDKTVQIQFRKENNKLHGGCGSYYAHIDTINEYELDLTEEEIAIVNDLISNNKEIRAKEEELEEENT